MLNSDTPGDKKRPPLDKRPYSANPPGVARSDTTAQKPPASATSRRCSSLSPPPTATKKPIHGMPQESASVPNAIQRIDLEKSLCLAPLSQMPIVSTKSSVCSEKESIPQCMLVKMTRSMCTKKREFCKMRKILIQQQKQLLEHYAALRDIEARTGQPPDESLGEVRVVSVTTWPAHDLLLLVRDDLDVSLDSEIGGVLGPHVMQQLHALLNPIPEDVLAMGAEIMARRLDLINLIRMRHRVDRNQNNLEWKTKNSDLDAETENLHRMVAGTAENLKAKITYSLECAKISWLDRDAILKKMERLHKENLILQHKLEETKKDTKKEPSEKELSGAAQPAVTTPSQNKVTADVQHKESATRNTLKDTVSAAEGLLRTARTRIATLERQLKDSKTEMENMRRKHKELEQLYRHRETSYDARSKKLIEVSKTGEITIETLSRQRDALELRVKELREQAEAAERNAAQREAEQRSRAESLQAKVAEQEKRKEVAEARIEELEGRIGELEEVLHQLRERSSRLVEMERRRCLEYLPSKENEPSDRETKIWKELQVTRLALSRAEEELKRSRADKDSFLNSLSKIAKDGADNLQDKIATELLDREQKIVQLQHIIEKHKENEKLMEQSMTQYENQLASLRLEVKRLRNYDCYSKEVNYQELQTELLQLHMQVETLTRERTALVTAAASRALMLERHERAADLFARVTRARRYLSALLEGRVEPPMHELSNVEVSRSLSSVCASSTETWTALRAERARVLHLEAAVLAQSLQLEREGLVRTQLERRRALLEREVLRSNASASKEPPCSVIQDIFCYR